MGGTNKALIIDCSDLVVFTIYLYIAYIYIYMWNGRNRFQIFSVRLPCDLRFKVALIKIDGSSWWQLGVDSDWGPNTIRSNGIGYVFLLAQNKHTSFQK